MLQIDSTKISDVVRIWKDLIDDVTNIIDYDKMKIKKKDMHK